MKTINQFGIKWKTGSEYGTMYHPNDLHEWYDDLCVDVKNGVLKLSTRANDLVIGYDDEVVTIPIATSRVHSIEKFLYGTFEAEIKLPTGKHLWPAFWLSGWLPEIDIMEAYTNDKKHYFKWDRKHLLRFWAVETNVHWKRMTTGTHRNLGGQRAWFGFKNPRKKFIKYKLVWKPDNIKIYYNNKLVLEVTSELVLATIKDKPMHVLFNNSTTKEAVNDIPHSEMLIRNFKYTEL